MNAREYEEYLVKNCYRGGYFRISRRQFEKLKEKLFEEFDKHQKEIDNYTPEMCARDELRCKQELERLEGLKRKILM